MPTKVVINWGLPASTKTRFVYAIWEIGSTSKDHEILPKFDYYGVAELYSRLQSIGSLIWNNRADKIQRWWRGITCNPVHRVGNRFLR